MNEDEERVKHTKLVIPADRAIRRDAEPAPVRQTPTTPRGQSAFPDRRDAFDEAVGGIVRRIAAAGPRDDQSANPTHHPGSPIDKTLRSLDRRRAGGMPPTEKTYIGPITAPHPAARVPESERRR